MGVCRSIRRLVVLCRTRVSIPIGNAPVRFPARVNRSGFCICASTPVGRRSVGICGGAAGPSRRSKSAVASFSATVGSMTSLRRRTLWWMSLSSGAAVSSVLWRVAHRRLARRCRFTSSTYRHLRSRGESGLWLCPVSPRTADQFFRASRPARNSCRCVRGRRAEASDAPMRCGPRSRVQAIPVVRPRRCRSRASSRQAGACQLSSSSGAGMVPSTRACRVGICSA